MVAFAVALAASQQTLDDVRASIRDLPLVVEGVVWLLEFPFLLGLDIWQASWDEAVRLTVIAAGRRVHVHVRPAGAEAR